MYGSQTPMYDAGSRTPHYGSQTPSHGEGDGSRTPGRSGAWDPTITNTPSANRDYDDYSFDDTTPSPNYNPGTPGYNQESPSASYTPATPGSVYNSQEGYSPYQPSPSPTGGYQCKWHFFPAYYQHNPRSALLEFFYTEKFEKNFHFYLKLTLLLLRVTKAVTKTKGPKFFLAIRVA